MAKELIIQQKERPICLRCGNNKCKTNGFSKNGFIKYSNLCNSCQRAIYDLKKFKTKRTFSYVIHKKNYCETCGFIPKHSCQLDVDHIDGDSSNNDESNLQTLCANCHRLKTYTDKNIKT